MPSLVSVSNFFMFCPPLSEAGRFQKLVVDTPLPQENVKSTSLKHNGFRNAAAK